MHPALVRHGQRPIERRRLTWEQGFVRKLAEHMYAGEVTKVSDAQVEKLDERHGRHFS